MIESVGNKVRVRIGNSMVFPFPYRFFNKTEIKAYISDEDGSHNMQLIQGEDFQIENKSDYNSGANITLLPKSQEIADGLKGKFLTIVRILPVTQSTSLPEKGKLPSEALETQLDKIVMVQQQQQEELSRCAKMDVSSDVDPVEYFNNMQQITVNAKDVALNAADSAAHSALTASISERNVGLIWAEITGDTSLAENALLTVKEAAEATGAIKTAKEIAIGEITSTGAMAVASTQKAADEALEAAKQAADSAGSITGKVNDAITIQVSQAVGADGVLGVAIQAGVDTVSTARQEAIDRANETLSQIRQGSEAFETAKSQGISQIDQKVNGVALDVETTLARAQIIADNYLLDAKATVSGSLSDLENMKAEAEAAGKTELLAHINKRIEELNTLNGYLTDAQSAASAAETFKSQTQGLVNGFTVTVDGALADIDNAKTAAVTAVSGKVSEANTAASNALSRAQEAAGYAGDASTSAGNASTSAGNASTSASNALKSAQDAALSASNAAASELAAGAAAGEAATSAAEKSITAHNASSTAHSALLSKYLPLSGGTMTGSLIVPDNANSIHAPSNDGRVVICGGTFSTNGAYIVIRGKDNTVGTKGEFQFCANDGTNSKILVGKPDGSLSWSGNFTTAGNIFKNINTSSLTICGGTGTSSAHLQLNGASESSNPGNFVLTAKNSSGTAQLLGKPDGTLTWNGKSVITAAGGKMGGDIYRTSDSARFIIGGATAFNKGARITLNGKDSSLNPGCFEINANNGTTGIVLIGKPDGSLTWDGKDITLGYPNYAAGVDVTSSYSSGWTATAHGWVEVTIGTNDALFINGTFVELSGNGYRLNGLYPVKKGDKIEVRDNKSSTTAKSSIFLLQFFPNR